MEASTLAPLLGLRLPPLPLVPLPLLPLPSTAWPG